MNFSSLHPICIALIFFGLTFLAIFAGLRGLIKQKGEHSEDGSAQAIVGALLGLLAFILGFTFNFGTARFDARKQLVLQDANALGTLALRTGLFDDPESLKIKSLIPPYIKIRLDVVGHPEDAPAAMAKSQKLLDEMWANGQIVAKRHADSDIAALLIEALNEVIDLNTSRITLRYQYKIPTIIWIGLLLITAITMYGVGYLFRKSGRVNLTMTFGLALAFCSVVYLIADLDNAASGNLKVNQEPIKQLYDDLTKPVIN